MEQIGSLAAHSSKRLWREYRNTKSTARWRRSVSVSNGRARAPGLEEPDSILHLVIRCVNDKNAHLYLVIAHQSFSNVMLKRLKYLVHVDTLILDEPGLGHVISDDDARARLALAHLRQRGLTNFAYFAPPSYRYSGARGEAFRSVVAEAGFDCQQYKPGYRAGRKLGYAEQRRFVMRWLGSPPKPIGVFAADSYRGRQLAEICQAGEVCVPDEVAILAGDSDELMCSVSSPPLSSVLLAANRIGHEAAALLDRMMQGRRPPRSPIKIEPVGVISRQSTDVLAIDDEEVVQAIRFIQTHATRGIHVDDVLREVPSSRRMLELQFRRYLGCSPAQHIRQVRLEKAKLLLIQTEISVAEIATTSGFANATRLGVAFRKLHGMSPRAYRSRANSKKGAGNR